MVEVTILGITLQENVPVLLLHPHGTNTILPLRIGPAEAFAISTQIHPFKQKHRTAPLSRKQTQPTGAPYAAIDTSLAAIQKAHITVKHKAIINNKLAYTPRPMTHDLTMSLIESLGGKLTAIEITTATRGVFYANAVIATDSGPITIDCRPSDGVALAVRSGAPVRCSQEVLCHAKESEAVLKALPEHIRLLAYASLQASTHVHAQPSMAKKSTTVQEVAHIAKATQLTQKALSLAHPTPSSGHGSTRKSSFLPHNMKQNSHATHNLLERLIITTKDANTPPAQNNLPNMQENGTMVPPNVDDNKWATLLHFMAPETKELM